MEVLGTWRLMVVKLGKDGAYETDDETSEGSAFVEVGWRVG